MLLVLWYVFIETRHFQRLSDQRRLNVFKPEQEVGQKKQNTKTQ